MDTGSNAASAVAGLIQRARAERDSGNLDSARTLYEEAANHLRAADSPLPLAHALRHVGDIFLDLRRSESAQPFYREALELYRAGPHTQPLDLANTLRGIGLMEQQLGNSAAAVTAWKEARSLYSTLGIDAGVQEASRRLAALRDASL